MQLAPKARKSLSHVRRELNEEELASPAVQRLLVEEIERLERDSTELRSFVHRFHEADKRASILEEKTKKHRELEVLHSVTVAVGSALLGYAPNVWAHQPSGWLSLLFGSSLVLGGMIAKRAQK